MIEPLSDEEIDILWDKYVKEYPLQETEWAKVVAHKAQQETVKQVVEIFENLCEIESGYGDKSTGDITLIHIKTELWQELKKEIEG